MFVSQEALNEVHLIASMRRRRTERKKQSLVVEDAEERMGRVLVADGTPVMTVSLFRYLGQML